MKKIFTIICLVLALAVVAQSPEGISYQAVVRDASGNTIGNQTVSFRMSIRQGSLSGTSVYSETHSVTTNEFGLATLEIGRGAVVSGSFSGISWGSDSYYLQTELDPSGGTAWTLMGASQFYSVPYSMYAKKSGDAIPVGSAGQTIRSDGSSWVPDSFIYNNGTRVGVGTTAPAPSASLDVNSTSSGVLLPRMRMDQRDAIASPAEGLIVFCTNCGTNGSLSIFSNGAWRTFSQCNISATTAGTNVVTTGQIIWKWNTVAGATGYKWNTSANYLTATNMGTATSKTETGFSCDPLITRYVWAYNTCAVSLPATLSETGVLPVPPTAGTHVPTLTKITWNWNTVPEAIGYKWSSTNNFTTATDMGSGTTKTETGLACTSSYSRYVWAYTTCGISTPITLIQSTMSCSSCGTDFTINHVAGAVAPVTKTVTYGTVINVNGEPSKCWITQNLGSDHQATAVSDATEASAGWYWQFNRKQGYKHDGITLTPTWIITLINENADWLPVNDPCALELGSGWRIPTKIEWTNVDASGGWTNWNGPWNSALKLHASGWLGDINGLLYGRGSYGHYWSSVQYDARNGWHLFFYGSDSYVDTYGKASGFSVRCLKD